MTKDNIPSEKQSSKTEAEFVQSMNHSFEKLEQSFSFTTPDVNFFEQKIAEQKKQIRKKWRQDLLLFSTIAIIILSLMFTAFFQQPYVFVFLQVMTVISLVGYTGYEFRKGKERVRHE
ncbi:YxlC family protein [Bacillus sp. JJ634]